MPVFVTPEWSRFLTGHPFESHVVCSAAYSQVEVACDPWQLFNPLLLPHATGSRPLLRPHMTKKAKYFLQRDLRLTAYPQIAKGRFPPNAIVPLYCGNLKPFEATHCHCDWICTVPETFRFLHQSLLFCTTHNRWKLHINKHLCLVLKICWWCLARISWTYWHERKGECIEGAMMMIMKPLPWWLCHHENVRRNSNGI